MRCDGLLQETHYDTNETALEYGKQTLYATMVAAAKLRIGFDFGFRASKSYFTEKGLNLFNSPALNDVHGLMSFPTILEPKFISASAKNTNIIPQDKFIETLKSTLQNPTNFDDRTLLAYALFNASFFQPSADSRFLLLVMAIEALIEPDNRSTEAIEYVSKFISEIEKSSLEVAEKNSLLGSLRYLKKESINQAGKKLVSARLGERIYNNKSAVSFFSECYTARSDLVHGNKSAPDYQQVNSLAAPLEEFVSDLLTVPFLELSRQ